ncbi:uncharacterized protein LOC143146144 [Ptiloglossa arizonensis]|uniref:uncharacterized protein LOC143146144 n=1 Tax=Ptiloglossa arizonensis TaxID=3350558 RepID=UPI003FA0103E
MINIEVNGSGCRSLIAFAYNFQDARKGTTSHHIEFGKLKTVLSSRPSASWVTDNYQMFYVLPVCFYILTMMKYVPMETADNFGNVALGVSRSSFCQRVNPCTYGRTNSPQLGDSDRLFESVGGNTRRYLDSNRVPIYWSLSLRIPRNSTPMVIM